MESTDTTASESQLPVPSLPPQPNRLNGRVIIITGAGGSIGLQSSIRFVQEGAKVSFVDINPDSFTNAKEQLEPFAANVHFIQADVTNDTHVQRYVNETVQHFGRLDCIFLNAGISYSSTSIFDTSEELYDKLMEVNVKSAFLGIKHAGAAMRDNKSGGSIILTSSIAGLRGTPGLILYSCSKFALRGLALTAAQELGQHKIRVNTIHPSGVNTPMFLRTWSPEKLKTMREGVPLGRFAEVEDVAAVAAFLASDDSRFMTGGFLKVDGGMINF